MLFHVPLFLEHGLAGHIERSNTAYHDTPEHAGRMGIDGGNHL
jgi:hypothetical protein